MSLVPKGLMLQEIFFSHNAVEKYSSLKSPAVMLEIATTIKERLNKIDVPYQYPPCNVATLVYTWMKVKRNVQERVKEGLKGLKEGLEGGVGLFSLCCMLQ